MNCNKNFQILPSLLQTDGFLTKLLDLEESIRKSLLPEIYNCTRIHKDIKQISHLIAKTKSNYKAGLKFKYTSLSMEQAHK